MEYINGGYPPVDPRRGPSVPCTFPAWAVVSDVALRGRASGLSCRCVLVSAIWFAYLAFRPLACAPRPPGCVEGRSPSPGV